MVRRSFLKIMGSLALAPLLYGANFEKKVPPPTIDFGGDDGLKLRAYSGDLVSIDHDAKIITLNTPRGQTISVADFYEAIKQEMMKPEHMAYPEPSRRHTDHLIELRHGYKVTTTAGLRDGSIMCDDAYYILTSQIKLGDY